MDALAKSKLYVRDDIDVVEALSPSIHLQINSLFTHLNIITNVWPLYRLDQN